MTRVLGPERVPGGLHDHDRGVRGLHGADRQEPEGFERQVAEALARLEELVGRRLGDPDDPLLVSVRSGARESMPGMLDTVLNLGLNDESVHGLAQRTGNERFAWDSYRRFVQMFGNVVHGVPASASRRRSPRSSVEARRDAGHRARRRRAARADRAYCSRQPTGEDFPADPREQLERAIRAVFDSWVGERAVAYRRINRIPDDWGTAVNVQQMVFGNKGQTSGSGVAFSRDEVTGAPEPSGDFLVNAQGEDVVSGVRNTQDISELRRAGCPRSTQQLMEILRTLERHYGDMQDTEFTIEEGRLYMLQTRNAKRPAQAAVRFAVDAVGEGLLDPAAGAADDRRRDARRAAAPDLRSRRRLRGARAGRGRLAGRGQGRGRLHGGRRGRGGRRRARRDPRALVHRGRRRRRLPRGAGHPHQRGRQGQPRRAGRARHGPAVRVRRLRARDRPARQDAHGRRHARARGRSDRDRRDHRRSHDRGRSARRSPDGPQLRAGAGLVRRAAAAGACAPTPTRPRTPARRASSAPRASACAAPSTCSWRPTASPRCAR